MGQIVFARQLTGINFANPSALVGLVAVPGAAVTAMRSDAAPAIDQGISPNWTATHRFSKVWGGGSDVGAISINSNLPMQEFTRANAIADQRRWIHLVGGGGNFDISATLDDGSVTRQAIRCNRTLGEVTSVQFFSMAAVAGQFDDNAVAGETRFMLYDVTAGILQRVSIGAPNSGAAGYRLLRIPN